MPPTRFFQMLFLWLSLAAAPVLSAQEAPHDPAQDKAPEAQQTTEKLDAPPAPDGPPVTVRGVVLNAATGQPLPRALVKITGNGAVGALTNGQGRFELHGIPSGVQTFDLTKPGFQEESSADDEPGFDEGGQDLPSHAVRVADGMSELSFSLSPKNAIHGHVTLSSGRPAEGIGLTLLKQTVADGRTSWQDVGGNHQSSPDGAFRFGGLSDGTYLVMSDPEFDNDVPSQPSCNADAPAEMPGYAPIFSAGATDLAGASHITVAGGEDAEANLALSLTKFHFVQAALAHLPAGDNPAMSYMLFDRSGRQLDYQIQKEKDNSLCVYLPDGAYTLAVEASMQNGDPPRAGLVRDGSALSKSLAGLAEFTVDGSAVTNLRIQMKQSVATAVNLRYEPGPPEPLRENKNSSNRNGEAEVDLDVSPLFLAATPVNSATQTGTIGADQTGENSYELVPALPGAYWIRANAGRTGVCLGAVTAGGQSLTRSPWTVAASGSGTPIDVVLRTDCASLTVQMPPGLAADGLGESASLYVYAVPEFDSMEGVARGRLDQFSNRSAPFADLPPGTYRVFAFRTSHSIDAQNAAALDQLGSGQEVVLEAHGNVSVVVKEILK